MSYFTLVYLVRLVAWGVLLASAQGALVLISCLTWERVLVHTPAAKRYRLFCLHFATLALLPALTLSMLHYNIAATGATGVHGWSSAESAEVIQGEGLFWLSSLVALVWVAGSAFMGVRLLVQVQSLRRLKNRPVPVALSRLIHRLARSGEQMSAFSVRSAQVSAPQVASLKPSLLLIPNDFERRMPAAEREAILLHELAHVERRDFGWNLLQRGLLALLWFQPVAWILYRRAASEREKCCDDFAVRHGARPTDLARALVRIAERGRVPTIAMAAASNSDLTCRIHYLLGFRSAGLILRRQRVFALVASVSCVLALAAGRTHVDPALAGLCNASILGWTVAIDAHDPAGAFALRIRRGHVLAASIEQRLLPAQDIRQEGERVTLLGPQLQPLVLLTVKPQGAIQWDARRPN